MPFTTVSVPDSVNPVTPATLSTGAALLGIVSMPFGITAPATDYVEKKYAATGALSWGAAGLVFGEAWGNARGRKGLKSFVPLFRS
jgi:hypothetical protein